MMRSKINPDRPGPIHSSHERIGRNEKSSMLKKQGRRSNELQIPQM